MQYLVKHKVLNYMLILEAVNKTDLISQFLSNFYFNYPIHRNYSTYKYILKVKC